MRFRQVLATEFLKELFNVQNFSYCKEITIKSQLISKKVYNMIDKGKVKKVFKLIVSLQVLINEHKNSNASLAAAKALVKRFYLIDFHSLLKKQSQNLREKPHGNTTWQSINL